MLASEIKEGHFYKIDAKFEDRRYYGLAKAIEIYRGDDKISKIVAVLMSGENEGQVRVFEAWDVEEEHK